MATTVQDIVAQLRQPVSSLQSLEDILSSPLVSLGVPIPSPVNSAPTRLAAPPTTRQVATLQTTILAHVCPTWEGQTLLIEYYFCPPASGASGNPKSRINTIVLGALSVLTAPPLSPHAVHLLEKYVRVHSLDYIWDVLNLENTQTTHETKWDEALRSWISIPGKVTNAVLGSDPRHSIEDVPISLRSEEFSAQTCLAAERIIWTTASQQDNSPPFDKLIHLVTKLVQTGHFSSSPSFFPLVVPKVLSRTPPNHDCLSWAYRNTWCHIVQNLPGPLLQTLCLSLFAYLDSASGEPHRLASLFEERDHANDADSRNSIRMTSYRKALALDLFLGPAAEAPPEVWNVILNSGRAWNQDMARAVIGWAAGMSLGKSVPGANVQDGKSGELDGESVENLTTGLENDRERGIALLLEKVLSRWTDPQYVSRALLSEHLYITRLLVLTLGALSSSLSTPSSPPLETSLLDSPPTSPSKPSKPKIHPLIESTSTSPTFVRSIGSYLSHRDEAIRRCGMLVAELVSGGKLDFGGWGGSDDGDSRTDEGAKEWQSWAADLRAQYRAPLSALQKEMEESEQDIPSTTAPDPEKDEDMPENTPNNNKSSPTVDAPEPDSDDESLVGYASPSESSSRAPSPTPSELEDPTLRRRPIPRPVYLAELGALLVEAPKNVVEVQSGEGMIGFGAAKSRRGMGITGGRGGGDAEDEKGRVEMALDVGAELVRRKRDYGSELEENAVNLTYLCMGLQDNFDLDRFEEKRQAVLVALVACCPTKAAPTIIEQFFHHQYSTAQRFTMLNALAIGARELAGLPIPPPPNEPSKRLKIDFPSKVLPGSAHSEYLGERDLPPPSAHQARIEGRARPQIEGMRSQVSSLVDDLSGKAIARSKQETEQQIPQVVRERALRVGSKPGRIVPLDSAPDDSPTALGYLSSQTPVVPFAQVAAEHFVAPLINRFWAHLQSSLAHEAYSGNQSGVRTGTGTGLVLNPLVLAHLLGTLAVLLHAARHSPAFLHVLAPDAAELALAVGTRPLSRNRQQDLDGGAPPEGSGTEAGVLAGALELALTVLDSALELDGGQVFALERADLLLGIGQWASTVFEALDKGERAPGSGGKDEDKAARIAAGLVLTSERIVSRWRRSISMV